MTTHIEGGEGSLCREQTSLPELAHVFQGEFRVQELKPHGGSPRLAPGFHSRHRTLDVLWEQQSLDSRVKNAGPAADLKSTGKCIRDAGGVAEGIKPVEGEITMLGILENQKVISVPRKKTISKPWSKFFSNAPAV